MPSPYELWREAKGDRTKYRELLVQHGHLIPKEKKTEGSIQVAIANEQWLSMGGGTSADILIRLGLPELPGIEVGPSVFQIVGDEGIVFLELRHPEFPGYILDLESAREFIQAVERTQTS